MSFNKKYSTIHCNFQKKPYFEPQLRTELICFWQKNVKLKLP